MTATTATAGSEAACFQLYRERAALPVVAEFTVMGQPIPKARARVGAGGGFTPDRTVTAEQHVALAFRRAARSHRPDAADRFGVFLLFMRGNEVRADIDNLVKLVLDALNGLAWVDDSQVVELSARRTVTSDPAHARTEGLIYRIEAAA